MKPLVSMIREAKVDHELRFGKVPISIRMTVPVVRFLISEIEASGSLPTYLTAEWEPGKPLMIFGMDIHTWEERDTVDMDAILREKGLL